MSKAGMGDQSTDEAKPAISPEETSNSTYNPSPVPTTPQPTQKATARLSTKTVEIKIAIPSLPPLPSFIAYKEAIKRIPHLPKKHLKRAVILSVIAVAAISGYYALTGHTPTTAEKKKLNGSVTEIMHGTPDYPTVLPAGKRIEDLGGWTRVSPPDRNPVFAYVDKIGNAPINVSQQPLPEDFKTDTAQQMEQLAQGFKANEKITVGSVVVHIGTSAKGPQSIIFSKGNLLVLIKSSVKIDNSKWAAYINSLE